MGLLQLSNQLVQKSPYWRANDALEHVELVNLVAFFNMPQCVICSPVWRFLYHVIAQLQKAHWKQE